MKNISRLIELKMKLLKDILQEVSELVGELSAQKDSLRILRNYMIWRLVATFYPSKYRDEGRRGEQCLKQTEDVFGPVSSVMDSIIFYFLLVGDHCNVRQT